MSRRIARLADKKGARLSGNDHPEVEKSANGQASAENDEGTLNESYSFQASPSTTTRSSEPQEHQKNTRNKWTREEYKEIIYCYYQALNQPRTGSTTKDTYQIWRERNPTIRTNLDEVKLANQRRWIERQKKLTDIEIDRIKQQIQQTNNNINAIAVEREERQNEGINEHSNEVGNDQNQNENAHRPFNVNASRSMSDEEKTQYLEILNEIREKYEECKECEITERIPLYKVNPKKSKTNILIKHANTALTQIKREQLLTFEELNHLIYAAATVVTEKAGKASKVRKRRIRRHKQPKWKERIQKQVKEMRAELSLITEIENGNNSENINKKKNYLNRKYNITSRAKLLETKEMLKMKIQAKAQRLRRYEKRTKQYRQNRMFYEDRKKLYRELGNEKVKVEKAPTKEEVERFWKSILENEVQHQNEAEWIKREEEKHANTQTQQWEDITMEEIKTAINNTSNWKSPGIDLIPNFWLKHLHSIHDQLTRTFNDVLRNPESAPPWLTTGKTFLLPKNKNTEQPQNYRPITCLTTTYKVLTSIIASRCYQHLDVNNILPEEQKGCKKGSYGCKDQLLINKMIMEDCFKKRKNLSMAWVDYQKAFDSVPHSWIIETLKIYKFSDTLVNFLQTTMKDWNTTICT